MDSLICNSMLKLLQQKQPTENDPLLDLLLQDNRTDEEVLRERQMEESLTDILESLKNDSKIPKSHYCARVKMKTLFSKFFISISFTVAFLLISVFNFAVQNDGVWNTVYPKQDNVVSEICIRAFVALDFPRNNSDDHLRPLVLFSFLIFFGLNVVIMYNDSWSARPTKWSNKKMFLLRLVMTIINIVITYGLITAKCP